MDQIIATYIAAYGPWFFLIYIFIKDILPKLFPELAKLINKRVTTEDRLFTILEKNTAAQVELAGALRELRDSLHDLHSRVTTIEDIIHDTNRTISKLIKED